MVTVLFLLGLTFFAVLLRRRLNRYGRRFDGNLVFETPYPLACSGKCYACNSISYATLPAIRVSLPTIDPALDDAIANVRLVRTHLPTILRFMKSNESLWRSWSASAIDDFMSSLKELSPYEDFLDALCDVNECGDLSAVIGKLPGDDPIAALNDLKDVIQRFGHRVKALSPYINFYFCFRDR